MMHRFALIAGIVALTISSTAMAQGRFVAVDNGRRLFEINPLTGEKVQFGEVSENAGTTAGLAYDAVTGTIYLTSPGHDARETLAPGTGNATVLGAYAASTVAMRALGWDSSPGTLYGGSRGMVPGINPSPAAAGLAGDAGLGPACQNLAYDSTNDIL